ncbi:MAG: hypothetical protein Q8873_05320 [Bacillota bacterium]|nr:hypothetical protein [Bacillota bacterium]
MPEIIMFTLFVIAAVLCDFISKNVNERAPTVWAYCLMTVCALAVVYTVNMGMKFPSINDTMESAYRLIKK